MSKEIPPEHIGDGIYFSDEKYSVAICVNDHKNYVAWIDLNDIDKAIDYLKKVKKRHEE